MNNGCAFVFRVRQSKKLTLKNKPPRPFKTSELFAQHSAICYKCGDAAYVASFMLIHIQCADDVYNSVDLPSSY
jgi:hypothetical protein